MYWAVVTPLSAPLRYSFTARWIAVLPNCMCNICCNSATICNKAAQEKLPQPAHDLAMQDAKLAASDAVKPTAAGDAAAAARDPIAGALQRFGLKQPTRPVGVAKIDLATSFTNAFSPAQAESDTATATQALDNATGTLQQCACVAVLA